MHSLHAALISLLTAPALAAPGVEIDLLGFGSPSAALDAAFAPGRVADIGANAAVRVLAVPVDGGRVDLELERFEIWSDDASFLVDNAEQARPEITLLRGTVAGKPGSLVVVGVGAHATNGFIEMDGKTFSVSSGGGIAAGGAAGPGPMRITDLAEITLDNARPACAIDGENAIDLAPLGQPVYDEATLARHGTQNRGAAPCRVVRVAVDTDYEWTQERFAGNPFAAAEYAVFLMAAISEIYQRDLNVRLVVPYLRTFSANTDPYVQTRNSDGALDPDPLAQVRDHWRAAQQHVDRDLTHFFTGADTSYGGVAYLSTMCSDQWGYGVSAYLNGSFPYPLIENSGQNWDLYLVSHELGHNFGTQHTHEYNPVIDRCGIDCSGNLNGTIMSYCHTCAGGTANIDVRFHPRVQDRILSYLAVDAPCNLTPQAVANDDTARAITGEIASIFVLANDSGSGCAPVGLASVERTTSAGGTAIIGGWDNPTGDPTGFFVRYVPPADFTGADTFGYTTTAGQSAMVTVEVNELREPEAVQNPVPGLRGTWYFIGAGNQAVPDFDGQTIVQEAVVPEIDFALTGGPGVGGPMSDNFGAVFEGHLIAPADGAYTLEIESDDGSLLYIGDDLIVDNDGVHGMRRASGRVGLEQGTHPLRIEFFQNGGTSGLIFRWTGPTGTGVVPASNLVHADAAPCPADLADPVGVLDLADITRFSSWFLSGDPGADLADPVGVLDLADISAFVASFTGGCP
jgi:hypothetical protein